MNTDMPNSNEGVGAKFVTQYRRLRSQLINTAAGSDEGTVRATLAYIALWLLASLSAAAYITHLSSLFR